MRIGMILDTSFPPDPRVENEAVSLIKAGHEVFLFSLDYNGSNKEEDINGIHVKRFPAGKIIYKLSALAYTVPFYHLLVAPKISEFIEANKIEVIHIHDMLIAQAVFDLNKKWKLPIVLDLHENRPAIMEFYKHVKSFSGRLLIDLKKWESKQEEFLKKADRVILVTEEAKEDLAKKYQLVEEKITAVPNTTVTDIFLNYPIQEEIGRKFEGGFNILYVGDTGLRRGTDTAIKAVALLKDKIRNIKLILVGKSKEDVILKELANKLGVTGHVSFEGWQDLKKFPSYILVADVCISPLTRNLHHDTTYANKIFQYMAMGKAVIVSDCIAQAKVVTEENCGLVHSAGNETDLAEKILLLFKNPNLKDELGDHARKAAESKYNWSITSKDLIKTYRLLEEKSQTKP